jgi:hypothetical protein
MIARGVEFANGELRIAQLERAADDCIGFDEPRSPPTIVMLPEVGERS